MAGFKKTAVIEQLKKRVAEQAVRANERHQADIKSWEKGRDQIQRSKKNVRQAVRDLTDGKIEIEEFSKRVGGTGGRYEDNWLTYSRRTVPAKPKLEESENLRVIKEKIALVQAYDGDALTVTEMKTIGVLGWVKG